MYGALPLLTPGDSGDWPLMSLALWLVVGAVVFGSWFYLAVRQKLRRTRPSAPDS